jgi:histidine triad (HIT) family protein
MTPTSCLFCKIVSGEIPAGIVYEDELVIAFRDLNPQAPHHLLIVPRRHIATTLDIDAADMELIGHIYRVAAKIAFELGFADNGFRIVNNCKEDGGQTVWHLHFHLLGGRKLSWPPG